MPLPMSDVGIFQQLEQCVNEYREEGGISLTTTQQLLQTLNRTRNIKAYRAFASEPFLVDLLREHQCPAFGLVAATYGDEQLLHQGMNVAPLVQQQLWIHHANAEFKEQTKPLTWLIEHMPQVWVNMNITDQQRTLMHLATQSFADCVDIVDLVQDKSVKFALVQIILARASGFEINNLLHHTNWQEEVLQWRNNMAPIKQHRLMLNQLYPNINPWLDAYQSKKDLKLQMSNTKKIVRKNKKI